MAKTQQAIVTFSDWDDTILPHSVLTNCGLSLQSNDSDIPRKLWVALNRLQKCVASFLRCALAVGPVCIVTNAENGWVNLSAQKFMPGLVPFLEKIHIISARSTFESQFPGNAQRWKMQAFAQMLCDDSPLSFRRMCVKNIVSLGDSNVEREAIQAVAGQLGPRCCVLKSVKFVLRPSIEDLVRQLDLVSSCYARLIEHETPLDLMLKPSCQAEPLAICDMTQQQIGSALTKEERESLILSGVNVESEPMEESDFFSDDQCPTEELPEQHIPSYADVLIPSVDKADKVAPAPSVNSLATTICNNNNNNMVNSINSVSVVAAVAPVPAIVAATQPSSSKGLATSASEETRSPASAVVPMVCSSQTWDR